MFSVFLLKTIVSILSAQLFRWLKFLACRIKSSEFLTTYVINLRIISDELLTNDVYIYMCVYKCIFLAFSSLVIILLKRIIELYFLNIYTALSFSFISLKLQFISLINRTILVKHEMQRNFNNLKNINLNEMLKT